MQNLPNTLKFILLAFTFALLGYLFVEVSRLVAFIAAVWIIYTLFTRKENLLPQAIPLNTLTVNDDGYADVAMPIEDILMQGSTLAVILLLAPLIPYFLLYDSLQFMDTTFTALNIALAIPAFLVAIVAHEFVHAATWVIFGRFSWRSMSFGIDRKTLSPYAHAQVPMRASAYRIGALMPLLLTGILPAIIALLMQNGGLMLLSAFLISAAVGDIYVVWIIKHIPPDAEVLDHPSKAGCLVKVDSLKTS